MKLHELKTFLDARETVTFFLPDGRQVPAHYHLTELGELSRHFIDCGGQIGLEKVANFQLWTATDYDHRLQAKKLLTIIELAERKLGLGNLDIEVEYQGERSLEKYGLSIAGDQLQLTSLHTQCRAEEACGLIEEELQDVSSQKSLASGCAPGSGCC